jgi:hypothetical protein
VRRDRTYSLTLIRPGHADYVLSKLWFGDEKPIRSQRVYRVAPGGRWLAYAGREHYRVRLHDVNDHEVELPGDVIDFRFSADGRWLAVARATADHSWERPTREQSELVLFDLVGPQPVERSLGRLMWIARIEWSADGIMVEQFKETLRDQAGFAPRLTLVSMRGEQHLLHEGAFDGFAGAARGHRAIVVHSHHCGTNRAWHLHRAFYCPVAVASSPG